LLALGLGYRFGIIAILDASVRRHLRYVRGLGFEDRLALLVDRELLERDTKRLHARLRFAGLRIQATPEDVDYRAARGLDRALFQKLARGEWLDRHENLLVTGPTGTGKTWLSCALGHRACRDNRSVLYQRVPRLLENLGLARGDGRYARMCHRRVNSQQIGRLKNRHLAARMARSVPAERGRSRRRP